MTKRVYDPTSRIPQRHRTIQEYQHDTYKLKGKLKEPAVCPQCGAVFHKGRWTWGARPVQAHEAVCPACHRINDKYPKGLVTLKGEFFNAHREELLNVVRNAEQKEKAEHPLSRIMSVEDKDEDTVIATTDTHLPRRIGEALSHAHHGDLSFHYDEGEQFIRVNWTR